MSVVLPSHTNEIAHREAKQAKPFVPLSDTRITLNEAIPPIIKKWERKLKVKVDGYFLQTHETKWGSCNHNAKHIRLNTQLVTKPKDLLEYVIVHEMVHLIEPTHSPRFLTTLGTHYPTWRESRAELNELPLSAEAWKS